MERMSRCRCSFSYCDLGGDERLRNAFQSRWSAESTKDLALARGCKEVSLRSSGSDRRHASMSATVSLTMREELAAIVAAQMPASALSPRTLPVDEVAPARGNSCYWSETLRFATCFERDQRFCRWEVHPRGLGNIRSTVMLCSARPEWILFCTTTPRSDHRH